MQWMACTTMESEECEMAAGGSILVVRQYRYKSKKMKSMYLLIKHYVMNM
jgi:hypothetical protein